MSKHQLTNNSWAKLCNNRVDCDYESGNGLVHDKVSSI